MTPTTTTQTLNTVTLRKKKDCLHSVQFTTEQSDAIVKNVYVSRPQANNWNEITVTVEGK
jgi:hypothetical protein